MANSRLKILIAASIYPPDPGGPAIHAERQYTWYNNQIGVKAKVVALAHYRKYPRIIRHFVYLVNLFINVWDADVIYAHDALGVGIPGFIVAKLFGKKFIVRIGGDLAWEEQVERGEYQSMLEWYGSGQYKTNLRFKLSRWLLTKADLVIVTSPILSNLCIKYYGVSSTRLRVIANPVAVSLDLETTLENKIVYASRLVVYKNLDLAIRVLSKVFPDYPDLKFIIMGEGPERASLEKLSQNLGWKGRIIFTGTVPQSVVLKETASCLFTLAPALTEFNPNYVLQGLSLHKPFIVSRENGFPFSVPEKFVFDSKDEDDLKAKILNLLDTEGYKEAISAVADIKFKMNWEDNLKANLEAIRLLINKK